MSSGIGVVGDPRAVHVAEQVVLRADRGVEFVGVDAGGTCDVGHAVHDSHRPHAAGRSGSSPAHGCRYGHRMALPWKLHGDGKTVSATRSWHRTNGSPGPARSASAGSTSSPCSARRSWCRCSPGSRRPRRCSSAASARSCSCSSRATGCRATSARRSRSSPRSGRRRRSAASRSRSAASSSSAPCSRSSGSSCTWPAPGWIDPLMPPVVSGAIVALIGFNLAPAARDNFTAAPVIALITLAAIILVTVLFKGLLGRLSIVIGVVVGYVAALIGGQVDFSKVGAAAVDRPADVHRSRVRPVAARDLPGVPAGRARARRRERRPRQGRRPADRP